MRKARESGLAGATVLRGVEGFGANSRIHTVVLRLSEDRRPVRARRTSRFYRPPDYAARDAAAGAPVRITANAMVIGMSTMVRK